MSTPSTATAIHPSHYGYSHHQTFQPGSYPSATASAASPRLGTYPYPSGNASSRPAAATTTTTTTAPLQTLPPPTMASYPSSATLPTAQSRKKKPNWAEFYKNGIPEEIIVIDDDDDEPAVVPVNQTPSSAKPAALTTTAAAAATAVPSRRQAASRTTAANNENAPAAAGPASKRRRTGVDTNYGVPQYDHPAYSIHSQPRFGEQSSEASISTDRTNSLHTTAPTSLGSHGSAPTSGLYYEDATVGQKRKRVVTRKSARDEQKRKEMEQSGDAFASYQPPPKPPIKAKDVVVTVVRDVSDGFHQANV